MKKACTSSRMPGSQKLPVPWTIIPPGKGSAQVLDTSPMRLNKDPRLFFRGRISHHAGDQVRRILRAHLRGDGEFQGFLNQFGVAKVPESRDIGEVGFGCFRGFKICRNSVVQSLIAVEGSNPQRNGGDLVIDRRRISKILVGELSCQRLHLRITGNFAQGQHQSRAQASLIFAFAWLGFPAHIAGNWIEKLTHPKVEGFAIGIAHKVIADVTELVDNFTQNGAAAVCL